jgi:hypothetical protein
MTKLSMGGRDSRTEVLNQHQKGETVVLGVVLIVGLPRLIPLNPLIVVFQFLSVLVLCFA